MKKIKNVSQGFTLLELLVVVLIIGILAAIALPQYKIAVGKARFSTLKTITRNVQDAAQRYYLLHNTYEDAINNLDIEIPNDVSCKIWSQSFSDQIRCSKKIFGVDMCYYVFRSTGLPNSCLVYSINQTDSANRVCQKETNREANPRYCNTDFCSYGYY